MRWVVAFLAIALLGLQAQAAVVDPCFENYPQIDFGFKSAQKRLALTFDDGPTPVPLKAILDTLATHNIKGTFFLNANRFDWGSDLLSPESLTQLDRLVREGHELASHTATHPDLATKDAATIQSEMDLLEDFYNDLFASKLKLTLPRITLFRPPFGSPFQDGGAYENTVLGKVGDIVRKKYITVGWSLDGKDYLQTTDKDYIASYGPPLINQDVRGSVLMHIPVGTGVRPDAMNTLINMYKSAGYSFCTVEDFVVEKYGASSAQVVDRFNCCLIKGKAACNYTATSPTPSPSPIPSLIVTPTPDSPAPPSQPSPSPSTPLPVPSTPGPDSTANTQGNNPPVSQLTGSSPSPAEGAPSSPKPISAAGGRSQLAASWAYLFILLVPAWMLW